MKLLDLSDKNGFSQIVSVLEYDELSSSIIRYDHDFTITDCLTANSN